MSPFFNLYAKYCSGVSYTVTGMAGWILGLKIPIPEHGLHWQAALLMLIGALVTPYGVYKLVDAILYHIKLKVKRKYKEPKEPFEPFTGNS